MIDNKNKDLVLPNNSTVQGAVKWESPSNIAIVKYWGKYGVQLPRNASISFTLSSALTKTSIHYQIKERPSSELNLSFFFEGLPNPSFGGKVNRFLTSILDVFPFLNQLSLKVESENSFPHSAGIASSASSMSAIALCLCSIENDLFGTLSDPKAFLNKASYVARLGSGSACRSVFPHAASWGEHPKFEESSNLFATPFSMLHPTFKGFRDSILIISKKEKSVSSRAGHQLMENNPYSEIRYEEANTRMSHLKDAFTNGNLDSFGLLAESEALTLHALMMTSTPPYILMEPNSLSVIEEVRQFREENNIPVYFSLDAGPNIHLLYPEKTESDVRLFIEERLLSYCEDEMVIHDKVGEGPKKLE